MAFTDRLVRGFIKYPCQIKGACCIFFVLVIVMLAGFDLLTASEETDWDFMVRDDPNVEFRAGVTRAKIDVGLETSSVKDKQSVADRQVDLYLLIESKGDNLWTPNQVDELTGLVQRLVDASRYSDVCLLDAGTGKCEAPLAAVNATTTKWNVPTNQMMLQGYTQSQIDSVLSTYANAAQGSNLEQDRNSLFGVRLTSSNLKSKYARFYFPMGLPLAGYSNEDDDRAEQFRDFAEWMEDEMEYFNDDHDSPNFEAILFGSVVVDAAFQKLVPQDLLWAFGSMFFVWVYIWIHTQSIYLSIFGIWIIVFTMPLTLLVYRGVFQIEYYATLHNLAIFVILGVGADNIFVFVDAWNQAPLEGKLSDRLRFTYQRAGKAMLVTSFTTMFAFLATSLSAIVPISTFGMFAAIMIGVDYCMDMFFLPALVVIWQRHIRAGERRCCKPCGCKALPECDVSKDDFALENARHHASTTPLDKLGSPNALLDDNTQNTSRPNALTHKPTKSSRLLERYFYFYHVKLLDIAKYPILALFIIGLCLGAWSASNLAPPPEQENFFPDDHYITKAIKWTRDEFPVSPKDTVIKVEFVWGVLGIDRDGTDRFDPGDLGSPIMDTAFDISPPASQTALVDFCDQVAADSFTQELTSCWIYGYRDWLQSNGTAFPFVAQSDQVAEFSDSVDQYTRSVQGEKDKNQGHIFIGANGLLKVMSFETATYTVERKPHSITVKEFDHWEAFLDNWKSTAPAGINQPGHTTFMWMWMITEKELVRSAIQGMAISISLAFVVLLVSTLNIIVSSFATLSIIGILASVMGTLNLMGKDFGVTESIAAVILIGLSVDYVVHIGNSYVEAGQAPGGKKLKRYTKTQIAMTEMGISVLAGATTTLGAGLFLLGAVVTFFTGFGELVCLTIFYATLWSCIFFATALTAAGPEGEFGSLIPLLKKIGEKCGCKCGCLDEEHEKDEEGDKGKGKVDTVEVGGAAEGKDDAPALEPTPLAAPAMEDKPRKLSESSSKVSPRVTDIPVDEMEV